MATTMQWMLGAMLLMLASTGRADSDDPGNAPPGKKHCSETATVAARGCANAARSDYWTTVGTWLRLVGCNVDPRCALLPAS